MEDSIFLSQTSDLLVMKYYFLKFKLNFVYQKDIAAASRLYVKYRFSELLTYRNILFRFCMRAG